MPGYKVFLQDGGEIREGLACSYCKLLLKDPVQTTTGQRLCRECHDRASKDPSYTGELNPTDQIRSDVAVKREVGNLKVKCENYIIGCDWKGLFKQLMQHSQECQYVTVECRNPGCGQQVLKDKMEVHVKEECPRRNVSCKDCGKEMHFVELNDHAGECPSVLKECKNCKKEIPACKLGDHTIHECKQVGCVCKDGNVYEVGSMKFHDHLRDANKLADHLGPMICEFTKMSEAFKEMTVSYQQATKRIDTLEKHHQGDTQRIEILEKQCQENAQRIEMMEKRNDELKEGAKEAGRKAKFIKVDLENKIKALEKQNGDLSIANESLSKKVSSMALVFQHLEQQITQRVGFLEKRWVNLNSEINKLKRCQGISVLSPKLPLYDNELVQYEQFSSDPVKPLEEKVLQLEKDLQELKGLFNEHNHNNALPPSCVMLDELCSNTKHVEEKVCSNIRQLEDKVLELEIAFNADREYYSELMFPLQVSLASTHNGEFLWRIPDVRQRNRDARFGGTSIYSPPFYTGRNGYKMCMKVYFNGYDTGLCTHLSIFFVLMKGEYDRLLQWPFQSKVSLILVDQDHKKHLVQTFKPNAQSSSFQKPKTDMNVVSGCPEFADLAVLDNTSYVKDDVMYIKAIVDTSNILHP